MKILAIETSSEACSAALLINDEIRQRYQFAPQKHAELILPMLESLLAEAQLSLNAMDALAFGRGPGAFTGVRIASGVIQGLAFGADLPVVPVSSLAALAQQLHRETGETQLLAAFDARMKELYWGAYEVDADHQLVRLVGDEVVCLPEQVPLPTAGAWHGVGSGWCAYAAALNERLAPRLSGWMGDERYPRAEEVAQLALSRFKKGLAVSAEHALPVYLRDNVVRQPQSDIAQEKREGNTAIKKPL
ncbi:MAG: tRNA (adenosine(37)-N6)-threonylcarbamoyltransferase complex dimerization subunit type 1 TsaB [Gammaproteobacteria bacterium]|nr:tRNA (adenosine(37)-N6)-threonylcarbamoyltransferase complex dimerization subunit type 1 TsaB [Gammaproteobacteria bacterium]